MKQILLTLVGFVSLLVGFTQQAYAAIDTTAVGTAISAAVSDGEAVGTLVIGAIATLAVIGVLIAVVHKLR